MDCGLDGGFVGFEGRVFDFDDLEVDEEDALNLLEKRTGGGGGIGGDDAGRSSLGGVAET